MSDFKPSVTESRSPNVSEVLVKTRYLGFDPAQKGWMENNANYMAPTHIGDVMTGSGIGDVIESNHPRLQRDRRIAVRPWTDG